MSEQASALDTDILLPYADTGIKPMTPKELAQYQGVESGEYPSEYYIRRKAEEGACYYEELGCKTMIIFPTSNSIDNLFEDTSTRDFEQLQRHLRENSLRKEIMEPFQVHTANSIRKLLGTYSWGKSVRRAIRNNDIPCIEHTNTYCVIVKPSYAGCFVAGNEEYEAERFAESIMSHFENEFLPGIKKFCQ